MKGNILSVIKRNSMTLLGAAMIVSVMAVPTQSLAQIVPLSSGNSTATVDLGTSAGMNSWVVDGGNHLNQQWFWYRVGSGGLAAPINTIGTLSYTTTGTDTLAATYAGATFDLKITYKLTGGAISSGTSDILESIMVNNHSGGTLNFSLFQYSDFNLGGTAGGDSVEVFYNGFSGYDFASQTEGLTEIGETITSPAANRAETALYDATLVSLTTVAGYNLNNTLTAGPGDVTWSLQWDKVIGDGLSLDVFKDKGLYVTPIPEPSAMALVALGLCALGIARRRQ